MPKTRQICFGNQIFTLASIVLLIDQTFFCSPPNGHVFGVFGATHAAAAVAPTQHESKSMQKQSSSLLQRPPKRRRLNDGTVAVGEAAKTANDAEKLLKTNQHQQQHPPLVIRHEIWVDINSMFLWDVKLRNIKRDRFCTNFRLSMGDSKQYKIMAAFKNKEFVYPNTCESNNRSPDVSKSKLSSMENVSPPGRVWTKEVDGDESGKLIWRELCRQATKQQNIASRSGANKKASAAPIDFSKCDEGLNVEQNKKTATSSTLEFWHFNPKPAFQYAPVNPQIVDAAMNLLEPKEVILAYVEETRMIALTGKPPVPVLVRVLRIRKQKPSELSKRLKKTAHKVSNVFRALKRARSSEE